MKCPRKRLALRLAACAVIGALMTVLVAWGLRLWVEPLPPLVPFKERLQKSLRAWPRRVPSDWPREALADPPAATVGASDFGLRAVVREEDEDGPHAHLYSLSVFQRGWPFLALESQIRAASWTRGNPSSLAVDSPRWLRGVRIPGWRGTSPPGWLRPEPVQKGYQPLLPLVPLWPGFALDTALYGTLAFLLWSAPRFVRRQCRRRRGRCLACGYELKRMEKCPECGGEA